MRGNKRCFCCHLMPRIATPFSPRSLAQLCPKPWVKLPDDIGHICSSFRLCLLMYVGMGTHVHGYGCSLYVSMDTHSCRAENY